MCITRANAGKRKAFMKGPTRFQEIINFSVSGKWIKCLADKQAKWADEDLLCASFLATIN